MGYKLALTLRSEVYRPPQFAELSASAEQACSKFEQVGQPQAFSSLLEAQEVDQAWALLSDCAETALAEEPGEVRRSSPWQPKCRNPTKVGAGPTTQGHVSQTLRVVCKLHNQLGQLCAQPHDRHLQRKTAVSLRNLRARMPDTPYFELDMPEAAFEWCRQLHHQLATQEKQAALDRWRQRLSSNCVATTAWVKRKAEEALQHERASLLPPEAVQTVHPAAFVAREAETWKQKWTAAAHTLDYSAVDAALKVLPEPPVTAPLSLKLDADMLRKAAGSMKTKAAGADQFGAEALLRLPAQWWQALADLWNCILRAGKVPLLWKRIVVSLLPKKGEESRPIGLCPVVWRAGAKALNRLLRPWLEQWLNESTLGAAPGRSTADAHGRLLMARRRGVRHYVKQDLSSFFDSIDLEATQRLLQKLGAPPALGPLIRSFYQSQVRVFKCKTFYSSEWVTVSRGVIQGCPLSPTIAVAFGRLWADFCRTPRTKNLIFVDDRVIWPAPGVEAVEQALDQALDLCNTFDDTFGFKCRANKCAAIQPPGDSTLDDLASRRGYPCDNKLEVLGVVLQLDDAPDSLLKLQLDLVLCRLRYLRLCSAPIRIKKQVYTSLVVSALTWAAGVALPSLTDVESLRAETQAMLQPQFAKDAPFVLMWAAHGWQFEPQCVLNWRAMQVALRFVTKPPLWLREEESSGVLPSWQVLVPMAAEVCRSQRWTVSQVDSSVARVDDYGTPRVFRPGVDHFRVLQGWITDAFKQQAILKTGRVRQSYHRADPTRASGLDLPRPAPDARFALLGHACLATDDSLEVRRAALASGGSGWYAAARKQAPKGFEVTCRCGLQWPSRPHVTWNCESTAALRLHFETPTDRAQERLFAAPLLELPAAPATEPLGDVVPRLAQHLEALLERDAEIVVATDGSSDEDVGAMAIVTDSAEFACGDAAEDQSPFKFELLALLTLFRALARVKGRGRVRVLTDCQAAQQAVSNPDTCCLGVSAKEAANLFRGLQSGRLLVSLHWVPSHHKQQSWVPPDGLLSGVCRALNDRADAAANACRARRAAGSRRETWHRDKQRALKWECDVIRAAAHASTLLQEHVAESAATARRVAAAAGEAAPAAAGQVELGV